MHLIHRRARVLTPCGIGEKQQTLACTHAPARSAGGGRAHRRTQARSAAKLVGSRRCTRRAPHTLISLDAERAARITPHIPSLKTTAPLKLCMASTPFRMQTDSAQ